MAQTNQEIGVAKNQTKKPHFYILEQNSPFVTFFQLIISIVVVPNVLLNLYIMAFGEEGNEQMQMFL